MNRSNYMYVSVVVVTSVAILCCFRHSEAAAQNDKNIPEDFIPTVKPKHSIRHVNASKNLHPSPPPQIMDLELSTTGQRSDEDSTDSGEIDFSPKDDSKLASQSAPVSSTTQSSGVVVELPDVSSNTSEYNKKKNSSGLQTASDDVAHPNESSSRSKVVRAVAKDKETVVINANTDGAKLDGKESTGSNLWIYSNVVCILLVVGVAIFLIYYPKIRADRRSVCDNPPQSSTSSVPT